MIGINYEWFQWTWLLFDLLFHCIKDERITATMSELNYLWQIYQGLDIITNKVTAEERQLVAHHMIDCASPLTRWTVVDFRRRTLPIVSQITHTHTHTHTHTCSVMCLFDHGCSAWSQLSNGPCVIISLDNQFMFDYNFLIK